MQQATKIARAMVTTYGMSEKVYIFLSIYSFSNIYIFLLMDSLVRDLITAARFYKQLQFIL